MGKEEASIDHGPVLPPSLDGSAASEILLTSAIDTAEAIRSGRIDAVEVMQACLDRTSEVEDVVQAWAHLDPERALAQAEEADQARREGKALGPLHGVPVGINVHAWDTVRYIPATASCI